MFGVWENGWEYWKVKKTKPPKHPGVACFICKKSIRRNDYRCTVTVQRGTMDRLTGSPQFIWAHGRCIVKLIPIAGYTFPELEKGSKQPTNPALG